MARSRANNTPQLYTREVLLESAVNEACRVGYMALTKRAAVSALGCAPSLIVHRFGSLDDFKDALVGFALERGIDAIIAQAIANRHPLALAAPGHVKERAAASLTG